MPDMFSKDKRREIMQAVKSKNSKAELLAFKYLRQHKIYHQKHYKKAFGSPDIALPRKHKAVFIDGDFWHGRSLDELLKRYGVGGYWTKKIVANVERDKKRRAALREAGWQVLTVWESDINRKRTREATLASIKDFLIS